MLEQQADEPSAAAPTTGSKGNGRLAGAGDLLQQRDHTYSARSICLSSICSSTLVCSSRTVYLTWGGRPWTR